MPVCEGTALVIGGKVGADPNDAELALATAVGEREAVGIQVKVVVLRLCGSDDASWAIPALRWLHAHGRRAVVRTAISMPRGLVAAVDDTDATVLLELAHRRPELQRALLGPDAAAPAALLLQAQHCRGLGVPVAAHLGPLLPGLHDEAGALDSLVQHVAAAGILDVHPSVGQLGIGRLRALEETLDRSTVASIARAFDADAALLDRRSTAGTTRWRPRRRVQMAIFHHARRAAEARGLRVDACGCAVQCHLDRGSRREYLPVLGPGLFGQSAG